MAPLTLISNTNRQELYKPTTLLIWRVISLKEIYNWTNSIRIKSESSLIDLRELLGLHKNMSLFQQICKILLILSCLTYFIPFWYLSFFQPISIIFCITPWQSLSQLCSTITPHFSHILDKQCNTLTFLLNIK